MIGNGMRIEVSNPIIGVLRQEILKIYLQHFLKINVIRV